MEITKELLEKLSKVTGVMINEEQAQEIDEIVTEANGFKKIVFSEPHKTYRIYPIKDEIMKDLPSKE
jgi:hypothetical protein